MAAALGILEKVTHLCCNGGGIPFHNNNTTTSNNHDVAVAPTLRASKFTAMDTKYEMVEWRNLPTPAKDAAKTLGFEEDSWDHHGKPPSEHKWWEDLTPVEQRAATTLGWDRISWDTKYEDQDWNDLPATVKRAAESLGFTEEMWDGDEWPAVGDKWWEDMTPQEQEALHVIGYCKNKWNK